MVAEVAGAVAVGVPVGVSMQKGGVRELRERYRLLAAFPDPSSLQSSRHRPSPPRSPQPLPPTQLRRYIQDGWEGTAETLEPRPYVVGGRRLGSGIPLLVGLQETWPCRFRPRPGFFREETTGCRPLERRRLISGRVSGVVVLAGAA